MSPIAAGPPAAPSHLLYLHGFRSSPLSFKAQRLKTWLAMHRPELNWWCPQLPPSPQDAMALIEHGLATWPAGRFAVCGSSLGGFYATVVAQRHRCRAVVINPAVNPARDLRDHIGEQTHWHDPAERFFFRPEFVDELQGLSTPGLPRPADLLAIIATGDELLDWREMRDRYPGSALHIVEGSDHALSDFDHHLPHLLKFLNLCD